MTDKIVKKSLRWQSLMMSGIRIFLHLCFVIISITIVSVLALYMRLLWKPINLEFIQPFLEKTISSDDYRIQLQNPNLVNTHDASLFGIHIDAVSIFNTYNQQKHRLHDVTFHIAKSSLFQQQLGIKTVIINRGKLAPINIPFDSSQLSSDKSEQSYDMQKNIRNIVNQYMNMPLLKPLNKVIIQNIKLSVNNPNSQKQSLRFIIKELRLKRQKNSTHVTLDIHSIINSHDVDANVMLVVNADFNHDFIIQKFQSEIKLQNTQLPNINIADARMNVDYNVQNARMDVHLQDFKSTIGTITGSANLSENGDFNIDFLTNNIVDGVFYNTSIGLESIQADGHFDKARTALQIKNFKFGFPENVSIKGNAGFDFKNGFKVFGYHLSADIYHLTLPRLLTLWPNKAGIGAKDWIRDNMTQAIFDTSHFEISSLSTDNYPKVSLNAPVLQSRFSYLKPMQPATDAKGRLLINDKTFIAQLDSAKIGVLNVKQASLKIPDIVADIPWGYATARMNGGLKPLLKIIDGKPLQLMSKSHFQYDTTVGNFDGTLTMDLPLLKNVKLKEINMVSDVHIQNGSLKVGQKHLPLEQINADLHLTADNTRGNGAVMLYGIHNQFDWRENFNMRADVTTDLKLKAAISDTQIQTLMSEFSHSKISVPQYAQGTALLDTHIQLQNDILKSLLMTGDATNMRLGDVDNVWTLAKGHKKTFTIQATQKNNQLLIQQFTFKNNKNTANLSDIICDSEGIRSAKIDMITFKDKIKNLSGHYHVVGQRHLVKLHADTVFVAKVMDNQSHDTQADTETRYFNADKTMTEYPNILANLTVKNFIVDDDLKIDDANIVVARDMKNNHILYLDIESAMIEMTKIRLEEQAWDKRSITIKTDNAGRFITGTGIFENFQEGHLTADIIQTPKHIKGNVFIGNGTILKSPWIAKLLSLASLTGILDRLNSRGLSIDRTTLDFTKHDNVVNFKNGLIAGSAIGISFQGDYRLDTDTMNFYGALLPFYGINSLFSNIPIVGKLTSSRPSEGIVGMSYYIKGKSDNPDVSVNPLSVLGVGILRRLFEH